MRRFFVLGCLALTCGTASAQRAGEVERKPVFQRLAAEQDAFAEHFLGNKILWPADVAFHPLTIAVAGRHHRSGSAQINPDV